MNDLLKNNRPSRLPMAFRLELEYEDTNNYSAEWIDRLITSMYLAISCSAISIIIAISLGLNN